MRLFFAVSIPVELMARIEETQRELQGIMDCPSIRWARPDQYHYTVKFLGEQTMARAQEAMGIAEHVCSTMQPFVMTLAGLGVFPNDQRPSVLWIGASEGSAEFEQLARTMEHALTQRHFRREPRPPTAHLTIARIKTYEAEAAVARGLKRAHVGEIGSMLVDSVVLMRSILRPSGSEYSVVERFRFGGSGLDGNRS